MSGVQGPVHETPCLFRNVRRVTLPRFLLVTGKAADGATVPRWPGGPLPFAGDTSADGTWIAWRLAGANNRELGRSARVYAGFGACRDSIVRLRADEADAHALVAMDYLSGFWGWQLELGGVTIAVAGRAYRRERECRYNLRQFLTAVRAADKLSDAPLPRVAQRTNTARVESNARPRLR